MPDGAAAESKVEKSLKSARQRLIDVGGRSRLINFPKDSSRSNALEIVDEISSEVFRIVMREQKTMSFLPGKQAAEETVETEEVWLPADDAADGPGIAARHTDNKLQTRLTPEGLQRRLAMLFSDAKSLESEQGVSALFIAAGFLRWYEDEKSDVVRQAPLILLPVEIVRDSIQSAYKVKARADDLSENIAIAERLWQDVNISFPAIPDGDDWTPAQYFDVVRQAVSSQPRWSIDENMMVLGFFSFAKLSMYLDLDPSKWPNGELTGSPAIGALLGDGFPYTDPPFSESEALDSILQPSDTIHVVNADASQARAIETVRQGRHLVIQGPPGTGKSETITNIIATAVKEGKSVLFVAEKLAALNVVYERLVKAELGAVCLQLHSKNANKKAVLASIKESLSLPAFEAGTSDLFASLAETRDRLNADSAMLNEILEPCGISPYEALGIQSMLAAKGAPPPKLEFPDLARMPRAEFGNVESLAASYADLAAKAGPARAHPWRGVKLAAIQPLERRRLFDGLGELQLMLGKLVEAATAIFRDLGWTGEPNLEVVHSALDALRVLERRPPGAGMFVVGIVRCFEQARLRKLCQTGLTFQAAHRSIGKYFNADLAWGYDFKDVASLRETLDQTGRSVIGRMGRRYREANAAFRQLVKPPHPDDLDQKFELLDRLVDGQNCFARLTDEMEFGRAALGAAWQDSATDFVSLSEAMEWLDRIPADFKIAALADSPAFALSPEELAARCNAMAMVDQPVRQLLESSVRKLELDTVEAFGRRAMGEIPLRDLGARVGEWLEQPDRLEELILMQRVEAALREAGAGPFVDAISDGSLPPERGVQELHFARAELIWNTALQRYPQLQTLNGLDRSRRVDRFRDLEGKRRLLARREVLARHSGEMPRGYSGEMGVIRGEIGRKRGHMPVRKLMQHAGGMVQKIKPVMLMSPLSVAQFLPPGAIEFDLLVIDEASQVKPEDALGAIARAKQIVVVGDQKQLPPTAFFDRLVNGDDGTQDDDDGPPIVSAGEMESVLTLCEARGMPSRMLEWHYRSRHPSLIAVSNKEFYKRLFIPPAPVRERGRLGFHVRRTAGSYDRGGTKTNRVEVDAIIEAIRAHALSDPGMSLGVATFSIEQRRLIENLLEAARRGDEALDRFVAGKQSGEDVFVKNLENVQGDERDIILVSIGYGPRVAGTGLDSMNFGPVSKEGGERRLNVLFTRARFRCDVFASFGSGDINLEGARSEGARVLKQFLRFGETGSLDLPTPRGGFDSPFEEEVFDAITAMDYQADSQVGDAGYRIDLAIVHPDKPGEYILAVECDGAAYHSAAWARERDRLRQEVLERLDGASTASGAPIGSTIPRPSARSSLSASSERS